jgi:hypothetical protein
MIGEQKYEVIEAGKSYKLSTGVVIDFIEPTTGLGVTNEELVGILIHRLRIQGQQCSSKATSRAITKLEEVEECLWRRSISKGLRRQEQNSMSQVE